MILNFFRKTSFALVAEWIRRRTKNLPIFHGTGSSPGVAEQEKEVKFPSMNDLFEGCFGVS